MSIGFSLSDLKKYCREETARFDLSEAFLHPSKPMTIATDGVIAVFCSLDLGCKKQLDPCPPLQRIEEAEKSFCLTKLPPIPKPEATNHHWEIDVNQFNFEFNDDDFYDENVKVTRARHKLASENLPFCGSFFQMEYLWKVSVLPNVVCGFSREHKALHFKYEFGFGALMMLEVNRNGIQ